jgi:hypothetical protein
MYSETCIQGALEGTRKCALYEELPFTGICRLKLYAVFVNGKNETVIYRQ